VTISATNSNKQQKNKKKRGKCRSPMVLHGKINMCTAGRPRNITMCTGGHYKN